MVNVKVEVMQDLGNDKKDSERALEIALRKFRKELENEDVLNEVKRRQYYEKPSSARHKKKVSASHKAKLLNKKR